MCERARQADSAAYVAENNKVRLSRAAWKSFLTYFRHGSTTRFRLSPWDRAANLIQDYFPPAVRRTVVARSTVRTFVSATFQPRKPVEPYFRCGVPPGLARTNLKRKLRFDMWSACRTRARRIEHLDLSLGFPSVNFGEHERGVTRSVQLLSLEADFMR